MANPLPVDDREVDQAKSLNELRGMNPEALVRSYSADGTLYAYREDDTHVVVSNGRESRDQWTERYPAERTAVVGGDHLWTIPDNWEHRVNIREHGDPSEVIYHIPETGVDVSVVVPYAMSLSDSEYVVRWAGQLRVTFADSFDWLALERILEGGGDEEMDEDVEQALDQLLRRRGSFERRFTEAVDEWGEEALFDQEAEVTIDGSITDPWGEHQFEIRSILDTVLDADSDTLQRVRQQLSEIDETVIPPYPKVEVSVDDGVALPDGYGTRALIEAGCSSPEAIDYYHSYKLDVPQEEWAGVRGRSQGTVSENIKKARKVLGHA